MEIRGSERPKCLNESLSINGLVATPQSDALKSQPTEPGSASRPPRVLGPSSQLLDTLVSNTNDRGHHSVSGALIEMRSTAQAEKAWQKASEKGLTPAGTGTAELEAALARLIGTGTQKTAGFQTDLLTAQLQPQPPPKSSQQAEVAGSTAVQQAQERRSSTGIPEPFSHDMLGKALELFEAAQSGRDSRERAAWILDNRDGTYSLHRWPWSAEDRKETWKGPRPENAVGILHTHPTRADKNPSTSMGRDESSDKKTANAIGMPVYVLHREGLRKIEPGQEKPEVVELNWLENAQVLKKLHEKQSDLEQLESKASRESNPQKREKLAKKGEKLRLEIQKLEQAAANMDRR